MSRGQWFGLRAIFRRREASPVVPLTELMSPKEEQVGDDTLAMLQGCTIEEYATRVELRDALIESIAADEMRRASTEAEDIHGDGSLVISAGAMDEIRARKVWAEHWNARLKLDFDGGAR